MLIATLLLVIVVWGLVYAWYSPFFHDSFLLKKPKGCLNLNSYLSSASFLKFQAVLLLRPSITLFSTDGMPYNCGPLYPDANDDLGYAEQVERTCDCLTQSLGCFGCGNTIGCKLPPTSSRCTKRDSLKAPTNPTFPLLISSFVVSSADHIISPCSRCVDSVSKHRRAANGHRWVFHYGEVNYKERTYVSNEPGVYQAHTSRHSRFSSSRQTSQSSFTTSSSDERDLLESRDSELAKPDPSYQPHLEGRHDLLLYDAEFGSSPSNIARSRYPRTRHPSSLRGMPLKEGDPVYWHHLVTAGERALPVFPGSSSSSPRPARWTTRPFILPLSSPRLAFSIFPFDLHHSHTYPATRLVTSIYCWITGPCAPLASGRVQELMYVCVRADVHVHVLGSEYVSMWVCEFECICEYM